jgi:hypothetical protein
MHDSIRSAYVPLWAVGSSKVLPFGSPVEMMSG